MRSFFLFYRHKTSVFTNRYNYKKINQCKSTFKIRYLGFILDNNLEWEKQRQFNLKGKMHHVFHKQLKSVLNTTQKRNIFHVIVDVILQYGIIECGLTAHYNVKYLEMIQKTIFEHIYNKNSIYLPSFLFNVKKLLDSRKLYCKQVLMYMYKTIKNAKMLLHYEHNTTSKSKTQVMEYVYKRRFLKICFAININYKF